MVEDEGKGKKRPLDLNWDTLLSSQENEDPPCVEIVNKSSSSNITDLKEPEPVVPTMSTERSAQEEFEDLTDHQLEEKIKSSRSTYQGIGSKLPDKGEKLRANLKRLEAELERRKLLRLESDANDGEKHINCTSLDISGNYGEDTPSSSLGHQETKFSQQFCRNIEDKRDAAVLQRGRGRSGLPRKLSVSGPNKRRDPLSNGGQSGKPSSACVGNLGKNLSRCCTKEDSTKALPPNGSSHMKGPTYVLLLDEDVDENDESQHTDTRQEEEEETSECMKNAKIYYPSREDPEAIEICYSDIECLAPEGYLSSIIMNFYIRHLQQSAYSSERKLCDYHFFNTYFYKKLSEAVSYKGNDKEAFFIKFRRWWKGVNIFQKAYILIPIHEDLHWSLAIICIPDKEDDSGPIVLHLDSLGLHHSKVIFGNIKSYLREEWRYMKQEVGLTNLPFSERIWENLPRRIDEKTVPVPQQKNDYDCGLFVLFFIKRFIEVAPERLKRRHLVMFGKQWFRPEEASGLRRKIRNLLKDEFKNACEGTSG